MPKRHKEPSSTGYYTTPVPTETKEGSPLKAGNTIGSLAGTSAYDIPRPFNVTFTAEPELTPEVEASDVQTPDATVTPTETASVESVTEESAETEYTDDNSTEAAATQTDLNDLWLALQDTQQALAVLENRITAYNVKAPHKI